MKIFISWSGERSKRVAELLSEWLGCVLQSCRPWISTRNIDRGSLWFGEIHEQLKDASVGIVVLTQANKVKPWIMFEAGALAKGLTTARVCTFLVDLQPKDVDDPLAQFNHTMPDRAGMKALVLTLNGELGDQQLRESVVSSVFDTYWPQFETQFHTAVANTIEEESGPPRATEDMIGEILEHTRALSGRLRQLDVANSTMSHASSRDPVRQPPDAPAGIISVRLIAEEVVRTIESGFSLEEAKELCIPDGLSIRTKSAILERVRALLAFSAEKSL